MFFSMNVSKYYDLNNNNAYLAKHYNDTQWNLNITKDQGTGKICSLQRGFVVSRFFSVFCTITGASKIVHYTEDFSIKRFLKSKFHCS